MKFSTGPQHKMNINTPDSVTTYQETEVSHFTNSYLTCSVVVWTLNIKLFSFLTIRTSLWQLQANWNFATDWERWPKLIKVIDFYFIFHLSHRKNTTYSCHVVMFIKTKQAWKEISHINITDVQFSIWRQRELFDFVMPSKVGWGFTQHKLFSVRVMGVGRKMRFWESTDCWFSGAAKMKKRQFWI